MKEILISQTDAGQRFDKYLAKLLPDAGKSFIYKMLRKKNILLNDKKSDGSEKISAGDRIKIYFSDETFEKFSRSQTDEKNKTKLPKPDIIYEDDNIIAVNKPSGMLSQKSKPQDISINEIIADYIISHSDSSTFKPGICNRLDRNTSGIVVAGKNIYGLQTMSAAFHDRTIMKYYICVVEGCFKERISLDGWIKKDCESNTVEIISKEKYLMLDEGTASDYSSVKTEFIPVIYSDTVSLVKVHLITGKTHQIRAHLKYAGYPIAGDCKYGSSRLNAYMKKKYSITSQMLHAYELVIPKDAYSSAGDTLTIKTTVPDEFKQVLKGEGLWQPGIQEVLEDLH